MPHYGGKRTVNRGRYRKMVATRIMKIVDVLIEGRLQPLSIKQIIKKTGYNKNTIYDYLQTVGELWPEKFKKQKRKRPHKGGWWYVYYLEE